jgi:hypothetical protein
VRKYKKPSIDKFKPNCHKCAWCRSVPGDAHKRCAHPVITAAENDKELGQSMRTFRLFSMLAGATRAMSINHPLHQLLNIQANEGGLRRGWFSWPYNFDPVWLENCLGWTPFRDACVKCELSAVCLGGGLEKTDRPDMCSEATWKWRWRNKKKKRAS